VEKAGLFILNIDLKDYRILKTTLDKAELSLNQFDKSLEMRISIMS